MAGASSHEKFTRRSAPRQFRQVGVGGSSPRYCLASSGVRLRCKRRHAVSTIESRSAAHIRASPSPEAVTKIFSSGLKDAVYMKSPASTRAISCHVRVSHSRAVLSRLAVSTVEPCLLNTPEKMSSSCRSLATIVRSGIARTWTTCSAELATSNSRLSGLTPSTDKFILRGCFVDRGDLVAGRKQPYRHFLLGVGDQISVIGRRPRVYVPALLKAPKLAAILQIPKAHRSVLPAGCERVPAVERNRAHTTLVSQTEQFTAAGYLPNAGKSVLEAGGHDNPSVGTELRINDAPPMPQTGETIARRDIPEISHAVPSRSHQKLAIGAESCRGHEGLMTKAVRRCAVGKLPQLHKIIFTNGNQMCSVRAEPCIARIGMP